MTVDMFPKRHRDAEIAKRPQPDSKSWLWSWFRNNPKRKENPGKWIHGVLICSWIVGFVLALNIILTIIASGLAYFKNANSSQTLSFASLYMGKCSVSKNWTTGLHLVINVLSTAMLGASNYCMQCLAAPSREQVDEAHAQKMWVRIGVPNILDLVRYQSGKRRLLGLVLLVTSLPIHLIYNSAVYFSIGPTEYSIVAAQEDRIISEHGNTTAFEQCFAENIGIDIPSFNAAIRDGTVQTLTKQECVDTFAQDYASGYGTLVLVTKDIMPANGSVAWVGTGNRASFDGGSTQFSWLCNEEYPCTKGIAEGNVQNWSVTALTWSSPTIHLEVPIPEGVYESGGWLDVGLYGVPKTRDYYHLDDLLKGNPSVEEVQAGLDDLSGWANSSFPGSVTVREGEPDCTYPGTYKEQTNRSYSIDHCMTLPAEETCQLFFSLPICLAVIGCNIVKLICVLLTAREDREEIFLTTGDAIASFLANPDPATKGACLLSGSLVKKRAQGWRKYKGRRESLNLPETTQEIPLRLPPRKRWFQAASTSRWVCTILLFICLLIPSGIVLCLGTLNYTKASKSQSIWSSGLGEASSATTLSSLDIPATASGIFSMIFMANIPQLLVSLAYFFYNGLLTCMLSAVEYDNYGHHRKPLRVSWPRADQRSTYYLSLPYRYSIPLLVVSAVLHWLVSQSLFFVQVIPFDRHMVPQTRYPGVVVTCGYSPVAIIFAMVLGGCMPICAIVLGLRRFRSHIPLAAQCSAAISAACHPLTTEIDHAGNPVQWGVIITDPLSVGISPTPIPSIESRGAQLSSGSDEQRQPLTTEMDVNDSEVESRFFHCTFTSEDVAEPRKPRIYL